MAIIKKTLFWIWQFIGLVIFISLMSLFVGLIFQSCATQDRCSRKFPAKEIVKDSIITKYSFVQKDTTIFVQVPAASGSINALVNCDSLGQAQLSSILVDNNRLRMQLKIVNGQLTAISDCKEDSLQAIITKYRTQTDTASSQIMYKEKPMYIYKMHWYETMFFYIGIILTIILASKFIIKKYF